MDKRKTNTSVALLIQQRIDLLIEIEKGKMDLPEATRRLRECTGLTQFEYAKLVKVAARALIDLERGVGNPTLGTLRKIAAPFGLEVRYMPKKPHGRVRSAPG